jgi:N-acetylglucosamine malate deacetylase 1
LQLVRIVEEVKRNYRPDILYTNSRFDLSVDQQRTCRAVLTAFRPVPGEHPVELLSFESPSSTEWQIRAGGEDFVANCFVDIAQALAVKLEAFRCLSFELREWPHPRSIAAIEHQARVRGASVGLEAAEAFALLHRVTSIGAAAT